MPNRRSQLRSIDLAVQAAQKLDRDRSELSYEIRIEGALSPTLMLAFPRFVAEIHDRETRLAGVVPDQAALHGALAQIEALGLTLVSVSRLA